MTMAAAIDLTGDPVSIDLTGEVDAGPSGAASDAVIELDSDDDDVVPGRASPGVEIVDAPKPSRKRELSEVVDEDGEMEITGSSGGLLAADLPHSRADCPLKPFHPGNAKRTSPGNEAFCANCWCYVCEVRAPCAHWTSADTKRPAHCNGHARSKMWTTLRNQARAARQK